VTWRLGDLSACWTEGAEKPLDLSCPVADLQLVLYLLGLAGVHWPRCRTGVRLSHQEPELESEIEDVDVAPAEPAEGATSGTRPRVRRLSSMFPVAEALLAAAHSDRPASVEEHEAIRRVLCERLEVDELPARLAERIASFDPGQRFDFAKLVEEVEREQMVGRRSLVELTRQVCDVDGGLDLREDEFMLALALALSLDLKEVDHIVYDTPFRGVRRVIKRIEDVLLGSLFLLICALPMLLIALAVKLSSRGPVLFKQPRHGENGREFNVLKFRTMRVMETGAVVTQASRGDPRVTKLGAFLRRTSLDELPQFINVVRGDMSLVGPRPHAVAHNEFYRAHILEYMRRHKVKPGITGWAQVHGLRGETAKLEHMVARVEHDLAYIRSWSLWLDLKIIVLTVFGRKVRQNAY
jgi:lipopolysaccharide/colanic/teichoic acid biosynthesis glycosyltransferase